MEGYFVVRKTIKKEFENDESYNVHEEKHRLIETQIAQAGASLPATGFALQVIRNVFSNNFSLRHHNIS
jgi:hypothetical protein